MPVHNSEIAAIFDHLADLLEIEGANPFRVRAYRNAARTVENLGRDLSEMVAKDEDLTRLPTIGQDLANKIAEIVKTGRLSLLDEVKKTTPAGLSDLTALPGLGPKRAKALYEQLHVRSLAGLKKAAEVGKVAQLAGFGEKAQGTRYQQEWPRKPPSPMAAWRPTNGTGRTSPAMAVC